MERKFSAETVKNYHRLEAAVLRNNPTVTEPECLEIIEKALVQSMEK